MALFSEEGDMATRLAREEEVLVEKRSKPTGSISREGNFVYNDRDEAGIKGAQNFDDFHFSTQMVPGETYKMM
ncbi:hypothetical protein RHMOL_Rhmol12G0133400 [Rhododendron molle]|uniref:Uncharacterized protein n=1 Tax=Rhododendron molle TaxID=49168 RepID=A0ACC0LHX3_RHOML|nr:hypothetical protein RHMOL_Rhmol12G0133400 [Rhododendron molle]